MLDARHKLGQLAEEQAITFLKNENYNVLFYNYKAGYKQVDIVALSPQGRLCFFEVKCVQEQYLEVDYINGFRKQLRGYYLVAKNFMSFVDLEVDIAIGLLILNQDLEIVEFYPHIFL